MCSAVATRHARDETERNWRGTLMVDTAAGRWPSIPVADWEETRDTLHLYTQVVGKVRMANEPLVNHWWNVPLYVSARGLTSSLMPHPTGPAFQIDFDLVDHRVDIVTAAGGRRSLDLVARPVAEFHEEVMSMLADLDVVTDIWPMPVEIPGAIPFPDDRVHASYDPDAVHHFWLALVQMARVFEVFRARFVGKATRLPGGGSHTGGCPLGRPTRRVRPSLRAGLHRPGPRCRPPRVPADQLRGGGRHGEVGPARARTTGVRRHPCRS